MEQIKELELQEKKLQSDLSFLKAQIQLAISNLPNEIREKLDGIDPFSEDFESLVDALILEYGRLAEDLGKTISS